MSLTWDINRPAQINVAPNGLTRPNLRCNKRCSCIFAPNGFNGSTEPTLITSADATVRCYDVNRTLAGSVANAAGVDGDATSIGVGGGSGEEGSDDGRSPASMWCYGSIEGGRVFGGPRNTSEVSESSRSCCTPTLVPRCAHVHEGAALAELEFPLNARCARARA